MLGLIASPSMMLLAGNRSEGPVTLTRTGYWRNFGGNDTYEDSEPSAGQPFLNGR